MKASKAKNRGTTKAAGRKKSPVKRNAIGKARARHAAPKGRTPRTPPAKTRARRAAPAAASTEIELEAAVLRRLLRHFDERKDVQNIELMILAGFCRNCLSKWLVEAASERGLTVDIDQARAKIYGMPYSEWKERHQQPATEDQMRRFGEAELRKRRAGRARTTPARRL